MKIRPPLRHRNKYTPAMTRTIPPAFAPRIASPKTLTPTLTTSTRQTAPTATTRAALEAKTRFSERSVGAQVKGGRTAHPAVEREHKAVWKLGVWGREGLEQRPGLP